MQRSLILFLGLASELLLPFSGCRQEIDTPPVVRTSDVIYGRKYGMALTMDVFQPKKANGAAVIWVVSGGWFSAHEIISASLSAAIIDSMVQRGYTVFAVVHGSQPKFTIPEILEDLNRSVHYVRFHASDYHIDPNRIGILGASSGGHLALMQGMAGDTGKLRAPDPVDTVSGRVQAVACFFPPSDFLNYGKPGANGLGQGLLKGYPSPFAFQLLETTPEGAKGLVPITNPQKIREIGRKISPFNFVSSDDPPTLIIHGDKDPLVPLQQSVKMMAKLEKAGVPHRLSVKKGGGHGWPNLINDMPQILDWFDTYLRKK